MKRVIRIFLKIFKWLFIVIVALLLLVAIVVKVPAVQTFIVGKATDYFNGKTGGDLEIANVDLRIPGYVGIHGVSLRGPDSSRIAYIGDLEVSLGWRYLFSKTIRIDQLTLRDVEGRIFQKDSTGWNYDFIIKAFSDSTEAVSDTASGSSWDFSIGRINLSNIDGAYYDYTTGDSIHSIIRELNIGMNEVSVNENIYQASSIVLKNSAGFIRIGERAVPPVRAENVDTSPEAEDTYALNLGLRELTLENNTFLYEMGPVPDKYFFHIGALRGELNELDLEKQKYRVDLLTLDQSDIHIKMAPSVEDTTTTTSLFAPVNAQIDALKVSGVNFKMETYGDPASTIVLKNAGIKLTDAVADSTQYAGTLEGVNGDYNDFDRLKHLSTSFRLAADASHLKNLDLQYGQSLLKANIDLKYTSLENLIATGNFSSAKVDVATLDVYPDDIRHAGKNLAISDSVLVLPQNPVSMQLYATANLEQLNLENLYIETGSTHLSLKGYAQGRDFSSKNYTVDQLNLFLSRRDILPYITAFDLDTTYIPPVTSLNLSGIFYPDSTRLQSEVASSYGDFSLSANGGGYASDTLPLEGTLKSRYINYAAFAGMPDTLSSDIVLVAKMHNALDTNNLKINADIKIDTLNYATYRLRNLRANATLDSSLYAVKLLVKDTFVVASAGVTGRIDPYLSVNAEASIPGIDLQGLGISGDDLRGQFDILASYSSKDSIQQGSVSINHIVFVRNADRFEIKPVEASLYLSPDSTHANIQSTFIKLKSESNRSLAKIGEEMANTFGRTQSAVSDSTAYWKLSLTTEDNPDIRNLFIPELSEFEPMFANIDYSASKQTIDADISIPRIHYESYIIDSLHIRSTGNRDEVTGNLFLKKAALDSLSLENVQLNTNTTTEGAHAELRISGDSLKPNYFVAVNFVSDSVRLKNGFSINLLDSLILDREIWNVDKDNYLHYSPEGMELRQLRIYNSSGDLALNKNKSENATTISAENFDLQTLSGIITTDDPLVAGTLFGKFSLFASGSFEGKGHVEGFHFSRADFGRLGWEAEKTEQGFDVAVQSDGDAVNLDLTGNLKPINADNSALSLKLDLSRFDLAALPDFLSSVFYSGSGSMHGQMRIEGTTAKPEINGNLNFDKARIGLTANGAEYRIDNQRISVEPGTIHFNKFAVRDSSGRELVVDGTITHQYFDKIRTDLTVKANDFEIANLKPGQSEYYYGKLIADVDISVQGRLDAPDVRAKIGISPKTDLSFVVPESDYEDPFDDDLIVWTSFDTTKTSDILTREKEKKIGKVDIYANTIDLNGSIKIDPDAVFKVVIDSAAGDYLQIQGGGDLGITYDRTGNLRLNGTYEVADGFYQMTFYNIVKRRFDFQKGSRLVWNGDPMAANLDITALYKTRASVAGLMVNDPSDQNSNMFNERLDFEVVMNLKGNLMSPEISFDIRLAPDSRGAFGGSVDAKLADLRDNESELNKQVFALLVLNSFLHSGGGNDNLVANQARNSASQILSQQLNALSDKFIKGVDLNFNFDSYGGAAGEGNTDLSVDLAKSFMNDRIIVRIGSTIALEDNTSNTSQDSKEMMTNISLEYKITPDGEYRFKAFRKNDFEDIVIGRVTRTGVGILFQHDFNRVKNIFRTDAVDKNKSDKPDNDSENTSGEKDKEDNK